LRGVLLATSLVLAASGAAGQEAVARMGDGLRRAWRASSWVECLNSGARMQQARHRRTTPGLLALKRWSWNGREFGSGRRRKQTLYGLLEVRLRRPMGGSYSGSPRSNSTKNCELSAAGIAA
jgi:hypothetical protein